MLKSYYLMSVLLQAGAGLATNNAYYTTLSSVQHPATPTSTPEPIRSTFVSTFSSPTTTILSTTSQTAEPFNIYHSSRGPFAWEHDTAVGIKDTFQEAWWDLFHGHKKMRRSMPLEMDSSTSTSTSTPTITASPQQPTTLERRIVSMAEVDDKKQKRGCFPTSHCGNIWHGPYPNPHSTEKWTPPARVPIPVQTVTPFLSTMTYTTPKYTPQSIDTRPYSVWLTAGATPTHPTTRNHLYLPETLHHNTKSAAENARLLSTAAPASSSSSPSSPSSSSSSTTTSVSTTTPTSSSIPTSPSSPISSSTPTPAMTTSPQLPTTLQRKIKSAAEAHADGKQEQKRGCFPTSHCRVYTA